MLILHAVLAASQRLIVILCHVYFFYLARLITGQGGDFMAGSDIGTKCFDSFWMGGGGNLLYGIEPHRCYGQDAKLIVRSSSWSIKNVKMQMQTCNKKISVCEV